jgi:N-acyl-D-aspartate/D-glutamate deacylase
MRDSEVREQLLEEVTELDNGFAAFMAPRRLFPVDDPPDYEPEPSSTIAAVAAAAGAEPWAVLYDRMSNGAGDALFMAPILNYVDGNLDPSFEMLSAPHTVFGLGDGGAHCGQTCDASSTTFLLTHWARDRTRGPRLRLEDAVAKMTSKTAAVYGLADRGVVRPGAVGDLNLIDMDRLELRRPEVVHDLPAGGRRLVQRADGYVATVKSGEVIYEGGEATGPMPGRLLRSCQAEGR